MKIYSLRSFADFERFQRLYSQELERHSQYISSMVSTENRGFLVEGYSYPANKFVEFHCDFEYSKGFPDVNWRERLLCPKTNLNNRVRYAIHVMDVMSNIWVNDDIYMMEALTPLYQYIKSNYANTIGSEYLGAECAFGEVSARGIRNEDATALTFPSGSFNAVLSFDVFEHIPNYKQALKECFRILKASGTLMFTVPFEPNSSVNIVRAAVDESGEIEHLLEPEYHGDPVNPERGLLCIYHFGWEMLSDLISVGFSDAYAAVGWSETFGYFTPQIVFVAKK